MCVHLHVSVSVSACLFVCAWAWESSETVQLNHFTAEPGYMRYLTMVKLRYLTMLKEWQRLPANRHPVTSLCHEERERERHTRTAQITPPPPPLLSFPQAVYIQAYGHQTYFKKHPTFIFRLSRLKFLRVVTCVIHWGGGTEMRLYIPP